MLGQGMKSIMDTEVTWRTVPIWSQRTKLKALAE